MYALEQFMSKSASRGTELSNFNALTGISTKQLQQWQYAARQAGESNEEFTSSLKSVQEKMATMKLNKGAPEGLDIVARTVGFDRDKAYKDIFYVQEQLVKFANSNVPKDIQNNVLKGFGWSEGTIAASRKGVFNQQNFKRAPIYGEGEINQLSKVNVLWSNLEQKIEMLIGHFTAAHGGQLVADISKVADQVFKMVNAFEKLAEQLHLFQAIGNAFNGWAIIFAKLSQAIGKFSPDITKFFDSVISKADQFEKKFQVIQHLADTFKDAFKGWETIFTKLSDLYDKLFPDKKEKEVNLIPGKKDNGTNEIDKSNPFSNLNKKNPWSNSLNKKPWEGDNDAPLPWEKKINPHPWEANSIAPKVNPITPNTNNTQNTSINQNLYFQHEGKEAPKIKDSIHKSVGDAWKQLSAQSQGT